LVKVAAVLAAAALITAACGSSSPSATKKSSNKNASASTTTTTSAAASTTTSTTATTAKPATATVKAATATTTTAKPATPTNAAASTPGGSLSTGLTSTPSAALTGIGSSSIVPFYGKALYEYHAANSAVTVNYSGSGSGPGVTAIEQNTASFGQSETPMTAAQLAASKGPVLQVPVDLGGVSLSYHLSGVAGGLKLNGPVLAQIYLRQITTWNDPAIAALNPGVNLPNENIIPVFRTDTSGPGYDVDQYLIDTSTAWTSAIGTTSPSTTWPTAGRASGDTGEDLNAGVATYIQETEGAIGYVEYSYALQANFTNAAGAQAYPLANFSWALVYQKQASTNTGIVLGKLFQWIITTAQGYSSGLGYAPLPANAVAVAHQTLLGLETSSGSPIFTN
jgi:phosphate transport system substrate-binding protein